MFWPAPQSSTGLSYIPMMTISEEFIARTRAVPVGCETSRVNLGCIHWDERGRLISGRADACPGSQRPLAYRGALNHSSLSEQQEAIVGGVRMNHIPGTVRKAFRAISLGLLFLAGCASTVPSEHAERVSSSTPLVTAPLKGAQEIAQKVPEPGTAALADDDSQILDNLWKTRIEQANNDKSSNFTLGPGDVLRISLPQFDSQKDRTVRVSEEDTIALPLLGVINVSGMTESGLRDELARRVGNYVYKPQVGVFVAHTESREVAVLGSVKTPGRYVLASRSDTLMTMIGRAGGMTEDAAARIILVPAPRALASGKARLVPTTLNEGTSEGGASPTQQALSHQVVIDLSRAGNQRYLELPARSGDVIIVPSAGEVTVEGWVPNPGKFKITSGMTALSAIAAAGGAEFTSSATLLREQGNGAKVALSLDLSKIKGGAQPDVPLQGGDVVVVERSVAGAVPYSLYFLVSHLGVGFGIPAL
jgi:polysaccharide biosynthesis/export protein